MRPPILQAKFPPRINADERGCLKHRELTQALIGIFYDVYNELGYGFLESVYESALVTALQSAGYKVGRQVGMKVWFRGVNVGNFQADLIVNDLVIIEIKAVRSLESSHESQILNYLRCSDMEVGLLLNFGPRPTFKRLAFANERKGIRVHPR
jgi:GxxExxY protein